MSSLFRAWDTPASHLTHAPALQRRIEESFTTPDAEIHLLDTGWLLNHAALCDILRQGEALAAEFAELAALTEPEPVEPVEAGGHELRFDLS